MAYRGSIQSKMQGKVVQNWKKVYNIMPVDLQTRFRYRVHVLAARLVSAVCLLH